MALALSSSVLLGIASGLNRSQRSNRSSRSSLLVSHCLKPGYVACMRNRVYFVGRPESQKTVLVLGVGHEPS
jgi:hypothetical protein